MVNCLKRDSLILILFLISTGIAAKTMKLPEANLDYKIGRSWALKGKELSKYHAIYTFKRKIIVDSKGRKIIPAIVVGVRSYNEPIDPIRYAIYVRRAYQLKNMLHMYSWHDRKFSIKSGVMIIGRKIDTHTHLPHTTIILTVVYHRYTMSIFANIPTELYPKVKKDFFTFFRSLRLRTTLKIPEIIEKREKNHIGIKAKDWPYGLVKKVFK